jgi:hypothetical protein
MEKDKKFRNIFYLVVIGLLVYMGNSIYHAIIQDSKNPFEVLNTAPDDYINQFNKIAQQKLFLKIAAKYKLRNPLLYASYDKKYNLEVTKINIKHSFKLGRDVVEKSGDADGSFPASRIPYDETTCTITYNGTSTEAASKIYLSLNGDSVRTVFKNDSIACYYLKLKNASVQYTLHGVYEIYMQSNAKLYFFSTEPSVSLMFLKKQNYLYFLLLTVNDDKVKLDPDLLNKLISKE